MAGRGGSKRKTHCKYGHELTAACVYYGLVKYKLASGEMRTAISRYCKECHIARQDKSMTKLRKGAPKRPLGRPPSDRCSRGHLKTDENVYISKRRDKDGNFAVAIQCAICRLEGDRRRRLGVGLEVILPVRKVVIPEFERMSPAMKAFLDLPAPKIHSTIPFERRSISYE
jgi:hypothetical protein